MIKKKKCILVLGMHRSGTSALTGILHQSGVYLGDKLLPPSKFNESGYFESETIINLNSNILNSLGLSWNTEVDPLKLIDKNQATVLTKKIITLLKEEFAESEIFAIKDPRISILFPIWERAFKKNNTDLIILDIVRNPVEVANSICNRDRIGFNEGVRIWGNYVSSIVLNRSKYDYLSINYSDLIKYPNQICEEISDFLKLKEVNIDIKLNDFIKPKLKHFSSSFDTETIPKSYYSLYEAIINKSNNENSVELSKIILKDLEFNYTLYQKKASLYYDAGKGYSEDKVFVLPVKSINNYNILKARFDRHDISKLRLDPAESKCILLLKSVKLVDSRKESYPDISQLKHNGYTIDSGLIFFNTNDPQVEFEKLNLPIELVVIYQLITGSTEIERLLLELYGRLQQLNKLNTKLELISDLIVENQQEVLTSMSGNHNRMDVLNKTSESIQNLLIKSRQEIFIDIANKNEHIKTQNEIILKKGLQIHELSKKLTANIDELISLRNELIENEKRLSENNYHIQKLTEVTKVQHDTIQKMRLKNRVKRFIPFIQ